MQNCLVSISDMILISQSTLILLLLHVIRDFICWDSLQSRPLVYNALDSACLKAVVLNRILYALPVYFGYLTEGHKDMLKQVLKRTYRMVYIVHFYDLGDLNEIAQYKLFHSSRSQQHCLNHLYTVKSS